MAINKRVRKSKRKPRRIFELRVGDKQVETELTREQAGKAAAEYLKTVDEVRIRYCHTEIIK